MVKVAEKGRTGRGRKEVVGVPLDPEDHQRLQVLSESLNQPQARIVRLALQRFFAKLDEERGHTPEIPSTPVGKRIP